MSSIVNMKAMNSKRATLFLFTLLFFRLVFAQTDGKDMQTGNADFSQLKEYAIHVINFNREYPQEKVYVHMESYSPDYSDCALPDTADYRRTLHWEPDVRTDNLGRASVSFYNNKQTKKLHVRAEGFTRNGEFIVYDSDKVGDR